MDEAVFVGAFEALPHQAAILDEAGTILSVNAAWRQFARDNGGDPDGSVGRSYLAACRDPEDTDAVAVAADLQSLVTGTKDAVRREYPCHSPERRRWFLMTATRYHAGDRRLVLVIHTDITERRLAQEANREMARRDELTGLLNRNSFPERFQQTLELANRDGLWVAVAYMDLDHFKALNDRFGHEAGDRLLAEMGRQLRHQLRSADAVARLGGDEIVLCAIPSDENGVWQLADRLHHLVQQAAERTGFPSLISASIGVSFFPEHGRDLEALLAEADAAMYRSKVAGGGQTTVAGRTRPDSP